MRSFFIIFALMAAAPFGVVAGTAGYYYTVIILSSGKKVMECKKVDGGYRDFVSHFEARASRLSMNCTDANEYTKNLFNVACGDGNMGMMNAFWFKSEVECKKAHKKDKLEK